MNVLVIGSGGREHVLCERLSRSPLLTKLFALPGNAGTMQIARNIPGDPANVKFALEVARRESIDLTIVGPEDPLAAGIVDAFRQAGLKIFGPTQAAARLEYDKAYAKNVMRLHAIPTADARVFEDYELARTFIATRDEALVVKASGLARGKGAIVCNDPADAILVAERMLEKREFGEAGRRIVVEERLEGREVSLLAIVDERTIYLLDPAQDYKRLLDGDAGPNTGGMGAYSPSQSIDSATLQQIERQVFVPILDALVREEVSFQGVLYAGLMLTVAGPKVLEFNCRFGDPEAQVMLSRLRSDLLAVLWETVNGRLDGVELDWDPRSAVCVVMAAPGYPDSPSKGVPISGLSEASFGDDWAVYHAGTHWDGERVVTAGGRVLGVTGLGETRADARQRAYRLAEGIHFEGAQYRRDIAAD